VDPLYINPEDTATLVDLAPTIEGKPHVDKIATIDMENQMKKFRLQNSIFIITKQLYENIKPVWSGNKEYLLFQIVKIVETFVQSDKLLITNDYFRERYRNRALITFNMKKIIQHLWNAIYFQNIESTELVFDSIHPIGSTNDMEPWYTTKPNEYIKKSHVSHAVIDSKWELATVFELERNKNIVSWVKNDHLGFEIDYIFEHVAHKYIPDFLINIRDEKMLILEIKGIETDKEKVKRKYLEEWINAVNRDGRFGNWLFDVIFEQSQIRDIITKHTESN
jgi:type III restriction enzyme